MESIAFVSTMTGAHWGGSEELWSRAAHRLREENTEVHVSAASWRLDAPQMQALRAAGCRVVGHRTIDRLKPLIGHGLPRRMCVAGLKKMRPGYVVIAQGYHTEGVDWMSACLQLGIPYTILSQSVGEFMWPDEAETEILAQGFSGAQRCLFVSRANREYLERQLAIRLANSQVVWNPVNVSWTSCPQWPETEPLRLACIGRLHPVSKGQDILLSVMNMEKWRQRDLIVTFYGSGPNEGTVRRLHEMYGLPNVRFAGQVPSVEDIWAKNHGLVLSSRFEGLPLVVVEAMLCGRPCIVTDVAGNREVLEDGVTGFLAAAPSPRYLDEAMERAWVRRGEWQAIGAAAARAIRRKVPCDPVQNFVDLLRGAAAAGRNEPDSAAAAI